MLRTEPGTALQKVESGSSDFRKNPRCGSCFASTKAASIVTSFFPLGSAMGSYTIPGGTPKKTAQLEESRRRPRKCPGHWKVSGEATGTRPRFLKASH